MTLIGYFALHSVLRRYVWHRAISLRQHGFLATCLVTANTIKVVIKCLQSNAVTQAMLGAVVIKFCSISHYIYARNYENQLTSKDEVGSFETHSGTY